MRSILSGLDFAEMTLTELEDTLPNGFHDSVLNGIDIRLAEGQVVLRMDIDFSQPDGEDGVFREAEIVLEGMQTIALDGPSRHLPPRATGLDIDCFTPTAKQYPGLAELPEEVRKNVHSLYLGGDWNSYIHLAAKSARVVWTSGVEAD